ncbi:MAG: DUF1385 domain-containing protein [Fusicatenibacter sp.]|nr:DUF1385 domain-containing protein [Lachnospiraceae bacterium]MDY2937830.1 DUF1385 domain-containing protein [Fusicatenibacter sp.]
MKSSNIGGQAVMEGIMMMNKDRYSIAVRKPDGEIEVKVEAHKPLTKHPMLLKIPFLRGVFNFADSLITGMRALMYSASFYEEEEETNQKEMTEEELLAEQKKKEKSDSLMMYATVGLSLILAIGIFVLIPYFFSDLLRRAGVSESVVAVAEAIGRVLIFLIYLAAISRMKDIQRVFMYHGAEHKCINCIEHGLELNVENVLKSSREHKRCGTSFLMYVIVISVIFFLFIRVESPLLRIVVRLLLIPVIAGVAYEVIRLAGRSDNRIVRAISKPGLLLQRMTTREPDAAMAEVAICAVEAVFDWRAYLAENFGYEYEKAENKAGNTAGEKTDK